MEESQEIKPQNSNKTVRKFDWLKEYQWQKGQSGNPGGRPKQTLKEFAREFLASMSEEGRIAYFKSIKPKEVWRMAEGNPKNDLDLNAKVTIADVIKDLENGQPSLQVIGQVVEATALVQNTGQEEKPNDIPAEQSPAALPPAQVVEKYNPQESATGVYD